MVCGQGLGFYSVWSRLGMQWCVVKAQDPMVGGQGSGPQGVWSRLGIP